MLTAPRNALIKKPDEPNKVSNGISFFVCISYYTVILRFYDKEN